LLRVRCISILLRQLLFASKLFATIISGSLSLVASTLDSALDIASGSIMFCAQRLIRRGHKYTFPGGRGRLEPLAIIVFSSVMFTATFSVVIEAVKSLIEGPKTDVMKNLSLAVWLILGITIGLKFLLFVSCKLVLRSRDRWLLSFG
jgi:divalent metal cation (Fe/Co/Zn/Cd) transporter